MESGFTIHELLVVLLLGSLVVSFSLSLFLFAGRLFSSWQRSAELRDSGNLVVSRFLMDVARSSRCELRGDSSCVIFRPGCDLIRYQFSHGTALRNQVSLICADGPNMTVAVTQFSTPGLRGRQDSLANHVQIDIVAKFRARNYSTSCVAEVPWSSVSVATFELQNIKGVRFWALSKKP